MNQNFRFDINGLRAYAVALVVLFHFGVAGFSGGFIGVDIFFVISGFLMTKIIVSGLEKNTFNFLKFYISRANRIIPALATLIVGIGIIGWFTLLPQEFRDYAKHSIASLSFLSNIQYFRESGYFDAISHEKLLLHTWSLSVEWQFYIILPIFLYIIYRLSKDIRILKISYIIVFFTSLFLSIYISNDHASASFYLLPTRAWEMMAGGLIYLYFKNLSFKGNSTKIVEVIGFSLIFLSLILFTGKTVWPSYNAILPVFGTFLILLSNNNNSLFTNNKIAQFLGNTSYSIYLWHWPIVFYLAYLEKSNSSLFIFLSIILSILLGWLSYRFIENPTRKYLSNKSTLRNYVLTFIYLLIPLSAFGFIYLKNGIPGRLPEAIKIIAIKGTERSSSFAKCHVSSGKELPECIHGTGDTKLLVVGDSHAAAMMDAVTSALPANTSALDWTYSGCPTVENIKKVNSPDFHCSYAINHFLSKMKEYPDSKILIINRTNSLFHGAPDGDTTMKKPVRYIDKPFNNYDANYHLTMKKAYVETLCKFAANHSVYVTRPIPEFPVNIPNALGHRSMINSDKKITISTDEYFQRSRLAIEAQNEAREKCGVHILDTSKYFCDSKLCYSDKNGIPLYFDDDHLNKYGADRLIPLFRKIFN